MQVTPLTVLVWKLNANGLFAMSIMSQAPSFTLATCRARDLLLPVDEELVGHLAIAYLFASGKTER